MVKRKTILVYESGRSTSGWDLKSVKWESAREQGRQAEQSWIQWPTQTTGTVGWQANRPSLAPSHTLSLMLHVTQGHRHPQRQGGHRPPSLLRRVSNPCKPRHDIPKALAVVELALSQVALDQMDVLLAGCAGTAERGALGPLQRLRGGIVLRHTMHGEIRMGATSCSPAHCSTRAAVPMQGHCCVFVAQFRV